MIRQIGKSMRKALAQNPNLLRTMVGLCFALIFMLSYAVWGATSNPDYFMYNTSINQEDTVLDGIEPDYDESNDETTWRWQFTINGTNLTWVNFTASGLSEGASIKMLNGGGLWSHEDLGVADARDFSCSNDCVNSTAHERISANGEAAIIALTDPSPERRSGGTVSAKSVEEARLLSQKAISHTHSPTLVLVEIVEKGNKSTQPLASFSYVNEELSSVQQFKVDAVTEFGWAVAAVVGCFSMVLIPSFTVYFAARAKEARNAVKLEEVQSKLHPEEE